MARVNLLLLLAVVACALGVITAQHQSRKLFVDLEGERAMAQKLDTEWTQLQVEQGTWATNKRVEAVASRTLGMRAPDASNTVVINLDEKAP
jgi:cell division protein FtsL